MYGLINRGLERMVVEQYGRPAWDAIRRSAGVDVEVFVTLRAYPDDLTFRLVGVTSEHLRVAPDELLRRFGRYWVEVVAPEDYGALMDFAGADLVEFLHNLDALHHRVAMAFTNLQQPSFQVEPRAPGSLLLHYRSVRRGLGPFVVGLVEGLGQRFSTPVEVRWRARAGEAGADHDVFEVVHG